MSSLIWSDEALADVEGLYDFLIEKSEEAAARAVKAIYTGMRFVARHPHMGRPADGMPPEFREQVIPFAASAYVAMYHYDGRQAVVLRVRHGREAGYRGLSQE
jgi:plasmid stabilization system protein ParE